MHLNTANYKNKPQNINTAKTVFGAQKHLIRGLLFTRIGVTC
jgi:hypothetical protein